MAEQEEDFSNLPLEDRFVHKLWKVRKQAYEEAAQAFEKSASEDDPVFRPFLQDTSLWKAAVVDSNIAALQDALNALCAFLKFGSRDHCTRTRAHTIPGIVEKGLLASRPATKASALEALLLYAELDVPGPVVEDMLPALSHKQPKVIAASLAALTAVYHNYGCKVADPKPTLKLLPKVFGHADKNVRAEATNLAVEFYRWLREAVKPMFWGDLKPTQQSDLEAQFEKIKAEPPPKQERLLRTQQEALARAPPPCEDGEGAGDDADEEEPVEINAFDLAEPKDVLKDIPDKFYENLASSKWKDRKEAVDALHVVLNVPRIKDADFGELNRGLAKCMKDANVLVVVQAAQCMEALATGLRRGFSRYRSVVMVPVMERLKEKKQNVADALGAALDAVFQSTGLSDCLEDIQAFLVNKNPQVKEGTMKFLIRCLRTTRDVPAKPEIAAIVDSAKKLLAESSEVLRSGGAEILGTIMKIIGERAMNPHMEGLDDIRKAKVKEYFEKAEVRAKDKPKPVAPPPARTAPPGKKGAGPRKSTAAPAGLKKSAPAAAESAAPPLVPQHTSTKAPPGKLGMARPGSIKAPRGRTLPSAAASSPRRVPASTPSPSFDDEPPTPQPARGSAAAARGGGGGGGGLTGRSLAKLGPAPPQPVPPLSPPPSSGLTAIERAELEELRTANDRLLSQIEDMRQERNRLVSEIQELKNQNAGLIEDHTRDVLSIKAKETQLVRARSDAEATSQTNERLQREMDRLKRALNRAEGIGLGVNLGSPRGVASPTFDEPGGGMHYDDGRSSSRHGMSFHGNLSDERENGASAEAAAGYAASRLSPEMRYRAAAGVPSPGRGSPARGFRGMPSGLSDDMLPLAPASHVEERKGSNGSSNGSSTYLGHGSTSGSGGGGVAPAPAAGGGANANGGGESWKRAAEVTSQLKARIEMMKAKQGLHRP